MLESFKISSEYTVIPVPISVSVGFLAGSAAGVCTGFIINATEHIQDCALVGGLFGSIGCYIAVQADDQLQFA